MPCSSDVSGRYQLTFIAIMKGDSIWQSIQIKLTMMQFHNLSLSTEVSFVENMMM